MLRSFARAVRRLAQRAGLHPAVVRAEALLAERNQQLGALLAPLLHLRRPFGAFRRGQPQLAFARGEPRLHQFLQSLLHGLRIGAAQRRRGRGRQPRPERVAMLLVAEEGRPRAVGAERIERRHADRAGVDEVRRPVRRPVDRRHCVDDLVGDAVAVEPTEHGSEDLLVVVQAPRGDDRVGFHRRRRRRRRRRRGGAGTGAAEAEQQQEQHHRQRRQRRRQRAQRSRHAIHGATGRRRTQTVVRLEERTVDCPAW